MNLCRPPWAATRSAPGRSIRWKVLPSTISAPVSATDCGSMAFTVPPVPSGMKAGVSTVPCAVPMRPRRAVPSVPSNSKERLIASTNNNRRRNRSGIARARRAHRRPSCAPGPAKAATSMKSVERGRWKLVSSRSTARKRKPGMMKMSVSPVHAVTAPSWSRATVSRRRSAVVPIETTRPPRARASATALGGGCRHLAPFGMHGVGIGVVDAHRLEGAGADMQRDARGGDAGIGQRGQKPRREVQAGGGGGDRTVVARRTWSGSRHDPAHRPRRRGYRAAEAPNRLPRGLRESAGRSCRRQGQSSRPRSWRRPWRQSP